MADAELGISGADTDTTGGRKDDEDVWIGGGPSGGAYRLVWLGLGLCCGTCGDAMRYDPRYEDPGEVEELCAAHVDGGLAKVLISARNWPVSCCHSVGGREPFTDNPVGFGEIYPDPVGLGEMKGDGGGRG